MAKDPTLEPLRELASNLWVGDAQQRAFGVEMGTRMTVIRYGDRRLLIHSPVPVTEERLAAVRALGRVEALVAPNRFHHLYVADWRRELPDAVLYVPRDLERKRPDLAASHPIPEPGKASWSGEIEHLEIQGVPAMNEVVFFHPSSRTLVISDLAFNVGPSAPRTTRWFFRLSGSYERLAPTRLEKLLTRDRPALRASLERVLEWPFERVIMAHGDVLEAGARPALRAGYDWLLA